MSLGCSLGEGGNGLAAKAWLIRGWTYRVQLEGMQPNLRNRGAT